MTQLDPDQSGTIATEQFTDAMLKYIYEKTRRQCAGPGAAQSGGTKTVAAYQPPNLAKQVSDVANAIGSNVAKTIGQPLKGIPGSAPPPSSMTVAAEEEVEEEDEDEEMPEDLENLSPDEQQKMIKRRAATLMAVGLSLILVFSDPMVEVMSNVGERIGVPPFYVSFVLAPLASNASELIASLNYAAKKTRKSITVSLAALEGAACMNNTFCLAIFMALIYFKQLAWKFSAETLAILVVEFCVAFVAMQATQKVWHGVAALALFPASIVFIATLKAYGLD